jgi:hypothetical protein
MARSRSGDYAQAKLDLQAALKLAPGDSGVRAELDKLKGLEAAAKQKEKAMWGGVFAKAAKKDAAAEGKTSEGKAQE